MRRIVPLVFSVLLLLPVVGWATGFGGDNPPARIPIPSQDFKATVVDHGGISFDVDRASYNGEVFFYGKMGAAQITLPFKNVRSVTFTKGSEPETRTATARTKDGEEMTFTVADDVPCYGKTKVGNYSIETADIRSITIH